MGRKSVVPAVPIVGCVNRRPRCPIVFRIFPTMRNRDTSFLLCRSRKASLKCLGSRFLGAPVGIGAAIRKFRVTVSSHRNDGCRLPSGQGVVFQFCMRGSPRGIIVTKGGRGGMGPRGLRSRRGVFTSTMV